MPKIIKLDRLDDRWEHPLIKPLDQPVSRRRLFALGAGGVASIGAGSAVAAQPAPPPSTPVDLPEPITSGDADAVQLLEHAAQTMAALETFHFEIETVDGESTILEGFELDRISGDVRRPYDFQTTIEVSLPFGSLNLTAIGINGEVWITDPLAQEESWIPLGGSEELLPLVNPDAVILLAVRFLQDATIVEVDNGVTIVQGTVDFQQAAEQLTGTPVALPPEVATEPLGVLIAIDEQHHVIQIELQGPLLATESADVVRVVTFSAFNEPVEIEPPANVQTPAAMRDGIA